MSRYTKSMTDALQQVDDRTQEFDEEVKWEVKITGLPTFYSDGKSRGEVKQALRKLLKRPDDIVSIERTTPAALKKIRRGQAAGTEPGDGEEAEKVKEEVKINRIIEAQNKDLSVDDVINMIQFGHPFKVTEEIPAELPGPEVPRYKNASNATVDKEDKKANKVKDKIEKGTLIPTQTKENKLPDHLTKFLDKDGNPNKEAQARIDAGRKKRAAAAAKPKITDVTPKGYGPKEEVELAIMSLDHKEAPRKLKITQKGLDALRAARDKPKVKTQVKITKKGREAIKDEVELDEAGRPRGAAHIENTRFWDLKDKELHYIIKDAGKAIQANPTAKKATQGPGNWSDQVNDAATVLYYRKNKKIKVEAFEGPFTAPGSGSIAKPRKAKASDANKSIEQQMADARKESVAFQEDEWSTMWKNAAKERPKMSFKQATEFVDEVGLDKKEKKNALKTAKKWLR